MKPVNPFGKVPVVSSFNIIAPRACICNGGAYDILEKFGTGSNCACKCREDNKANENANHDLAYGYHH